MTEELLREIDRKLTVQLENQPSVKSDRFFVGDTDTVSAGTSLTVTFELEKLWVTRLVEGYADARDGLLYSWIIDGQTIPLNEIKFYQGKPVHSDIKLLIENPTADDQEVGYYIYGWGDYIGE